MKLNEVIPWGRSFEEYQGMPDLRLGQLIVNAIRPREPCPEVFSVEDMVLARQLERMLKQPPTPPDEG
jgi:hypothetical protein